MKEELQHQSNIALLLESCREEYRISETVYHYSEQDYNRVWRKFLKYAADQGLIESPKELLLV